MNMNRTLKVHLIVAIAVMTLFLGGQRDAYAVLVGPTPGGPHSGITITPDAVTLAGFAGSWTVGSELAPIPVEYLATNGLWLVQLDGAAPLTIGQSIRIHEYIEISDNGPGWTDWSQRFITEGFDFVNGTIHVNGNLVANGDLSSVGDNTISFSFDALPAGTVLEITKDVLWTGNASGESGDIFQGAPNLIQLEQFPTPFTNEPDPVVPEPATLAMLGLGVSLIGTFRGFRNRKSTLDD